MDELFTLYPKIYERASGWSFERAPQIFDPAPSLRDRLALAVGRFLIATGEKLVRLAAIPPQWEKKAI